MLILFTLILKITQLSNKPIFIKNNSNKQTFGKNKDNGKDNRLNTSYNNIKHGKKSGKLKSKKLFKS